MVRAVNAFECEWCGELYYTQSEAFACEFKCLDSVLRDDLVVSVKKWKTHAPDSDVLVHRRKRLALYDRLAKAHGIEQEEGDGEA